MSELTCGVLFIHEGKILLGSVKGQKHWDIPKGKIEDGETPRDAAQREVCEETGMIISRFDLQALGQVPYRPGKQMYLFVYQGEYITTKQCRDAIADNEVKELDDFRYVGLDELHKYVNARLLRSIGNAVFTRLRDNYNAPRD